MSTKDQAFSAALHGQALLAAKRPELQPLIDHLREVAQGRDDIRLECAGIIAGSWFAGADRRGEELIAAGLLMLAGHVDLDELGSVGPSGLGAASRINGALRPQRCELARSLQEPAPRHRTDRSVNGYQNSAPL